MSASSAVERALNRWLDLPETVLELGEAFRWHGRTAEVTDVIEGAPPQEPAGIEVSGSLARLLENGAAHLAAAKAAFVEQGRLAGVQARHLAAFAAHRPAEALDVPDEEVGAAAVASRAARPAALTAVSEWAVDEVMASLALSSPAAGRLLADSVTLVERLPATLAALEAGRISWDHARVLADRIGPLRDDVRQDVEDALLTRSGGKTVPQLREAARRAVLRADASAAVARVAQAIQDRSVRVYDHEDGMASLTTSMPAPVIRACYRALEAHAEACRVPGDERTGDQRMADCLADLVLRPGAGDRPPVQVLLTVVASAGTLTGGDEPGEVDGRPVPAEVVRELTYALGLLPRPSGASAPAPAATSDTASAPGAGSAPDTERGPDTELRPASESTPAAAHGPTGGDAPDSADVAALLGVRGIDGTSLAARPTIAVVDEIAGALLALTDATELRGIATCRRRACRSGRQPCSHPPAGRGLGPPAPTGGYSPAARLDRFVRARDRRCRFPGCRTPAVRCDVDHNLPWPAGPTSAGNLCCLCRHHHRLSHQAPGWSMCRLPDGGLEWSLPGGDRILTHPIPYGTDDLPPPDDHREAQPLDGPPENWPPPTAVERVLGRPLPPGVVDDDPPPF